MNFNPSFSFGFLVNGSTSEVAAKLKQLPSQPKDIRLIFKNGTAETGENRFTLEIPNSLVSCNAELLPSPNSNRTKIALTFQFSPSWLALPFFILIIFLIISLFQAIQEVNSGTLLKVEIAVLPLIYLVASPLRAIFKIKEQVKGK